MATKKLERAFSVSEAHSVEVTLYKKSGVAKVRMLRKIARGYSAHEAYLTPKGTPASAEMVLAFVKQARAQGKFEFPARVEDKGTKVIFKVSRAFLR